MVNLTLWYAGHSVSSGWECVKAYGYTEMYWKISSEQQTRGCNAVWALGGPQIVYYKRINILRNISQNTEFKEWASLYLWVQSIKAGNFLNNWTNISFSNTILFFRVMLNFTAHSFKEILYRCNIHFGRYLFTCPFQKHYNSTHCFYKYESWSLIKTDLTVFEYMMLKSTW